jgi:hypothetical protein
MNYAVEISVWGKTTLYVTAPSEGDAMQIAEESLKFNDIQYDYEVIDVYEDRE